MQRTAITTACFVAGFAMAAQAQTTVKPGRRLTVAYDSTPAAFTHVSVIAMDSNRVLPNQTVLIEGGRIRALGPSGRVQVPRRARVINGTGKFLIPGLADMHVHLNYQDSDRQDNPAFFKLFLANGVTTVLNLLAVESHFELRRQISAGQLLAPALYTSGFYINEPFLRWPPQVDSAIAAQVADSVDVIKTHGPLSDSAFTHLIEGAHRAGLRVVGHIDRRQGALKVERDGLDAVAHAEEFLSGYFGFRRSSTPLTADSVRLMIRNLADSTARFGTWVIPTLTVFKGIGGQVSNLDSMLARPEVGYVPAATLAEWKPGRNRYESIPKDAVEPFQNQYHLLTVQTKAFYDAGVPLLVGTDTPVPATVPGFSFHDELAELVASGLTAYDVLRAATVNAALFLNVVGEFGIIAPGARADLLLLDANPLEDIGNTRKIAGVMVRGRWLPKAELAAMVETVRAH